jgi:tetratricopeptide (TPR) repeat protein
MAFRRVIAVVIVGRAAAAYAGGPEAAAAEAAFDKGRELMKSGLYTEACAAFDQSERLDPQIGTLYNLAGCWEKVGKLASAWTAYREVAQRDTNATRRGAADEHARALLPRLPKLVINVHDAAPGEVVALNGGDVTKLVGIETPMDLGTYTVLVTAPGHQAWGGEAKIVSEGVTVTVDVPKLAPGTGKMVTTTTTTHAPDTHAPPPKPAPVLPKAEAHAEPAGSSSSHLPVIVMAGGGALVIGGLVTGVLARGQQKDVRRRRRAGARQRAARAVAHARRRLDRAGRRRRGGPRGRRLPVVAPAQR